MALTYGLTRLSALKASQNTVLKLRAETPKHSQATVVGSPNFEATSETIVENPSKAHLSGVRRGDSSPVKERVSKEFSFIRRRG
jgi:hypothetical protein